MATYLVPDHPHIESFFCHLWRSILIFANSTSYAWSSNHINMLARVRGLVWHFASWKSPTYWNQVSCVISALHHCFLVVLHSTKRKWWDREGSSGPWPGYAISMKVIFNPAEVCFPRRPRAVLPRSQVLRDTSSAITWNPCFSFKHQTEVDLHADV